MKYVEGRIENYLITGFNIRRFCIGNITKLMSGIICFYQIRFHFRPSIERQSLTSTQDIKFWLMN